MTGEPAGGGRNDVLERLFVPLFFTLGGAGLLLSTEYFLDLPSLLVAISTVAVVVGLPLFFASAIATSRRQGIGVVRAIGQGFRETIRVVCDFFPV